MANDELESVMAELAYADPGRALEWLAATFGFTTRMVVTDDDGEIVYAETGLGEQLVAIVPEVPGLLTTPRAVNGRSTQRVRIRFAEDVDAHCARARAAGAAIRQEPETFFFGDRSYQATDLEGHLWSFNQRVTRGRRPPERWQVVHPATA